MSNPKQRYVRNTKTGVIYAYTPELGKHRHCTPMSLDLCVEYERRVAEGPQAVRNMEERLLKADTDGEVLSSSELAASLATTPVVPVVAPVVVADIKIPADFDLDVDVGPLGKPELQALGGRIGFPMPNNMKVAEMKKALREVLDAAKAEQAKAPAPKLSDDDIDETDL